MKTKRYQIIICTFLCTLNMFAVKANMNFVDLSGEWMTEDRTKLSLVWQGGSFISYDEQRQEQSKFMPMSSTEFRMSYYRNSDKGDSKLYTSKVSFKNETLRKKRGGKFMWRISRANQSGSMEISSLESMTPNSQPVYPVAPYPYYQAGEPYPVGAYPQTEMPQSNMYNSQGGPQNQPMTTMPQAAYPQNHPVSRIQQNPAAPTQPNNWIPANTISQSQSFSSPSNQSIKTVNQQVMTNGYPVAQPVGQNRHNPAVNSNSYPAIPRQSSPISMTSTQQGASYPAQPYYPTIPQSGTNLAPASFPGFEVAQAQGIGLQRSKNLLTTSKDLKREEKIQREAQKLELQAIKGARGKLKGQSVQNKLQILTSLTGAASGNISSINSLISNLSGSN